MFNARFIRRVVGLLVFLMVFGAAAAFAAPEYKWRFGQTSVRASQGKSYKLFCELISELRKHLLPS